jgi:predicted aminopeptidase
MKWRLVAAASAVVLVVGCQSLSYYTQAIGGHLKVMANARPIDDWLADPATDAQLRERLETARRIRAFASKQLGLPDNGSYLAYADLNRPAVVWNVFAASAFSVEPKAECFPFTGCVSYRGFYAEADARRHADKLREDGYDVYVGGVPAYSTLGWFDDPLLSTFIRYPFAVTVEQEGVRRWLAAEGRTAELAEFRATQERRREFAQRVKQTRERLAVVYASTLPNEAMLEQKRGEWQRLRQSYPGIPAEPNNAFLASIAAYTELVPAFEQLLAESGSLQAFYQRTKALATKPAEREAFVRKSGYRPSS